MILFKGCRVYAPEFLGEKDILVAGGRIAALGNGLQPAGGCETLVDRRPGAAPAARPDRQPRAHRRRRRRGRPGHPHSGNAPAGYGGGRDHHRHRLPGHRRPDPLGGLGADEGQGASPGRRFGLDLHRSLPGAHAHPARRRGQGPGHDRGGHRRRRDRHRRSSLLQPQRRRADPPGQTGPRRRHDRRQGRHRQHPPRRRPAAVLAAGRGRQRGANCASASSCPPTATARAPCSRRPRNTAAKDTST